MKISVPKVSGPFLIVEEWKYIKKNKAIEILSYLLEIDVFAFLIVNTTLDIVSALRPVSRKSR